MRHVVVVENSSDNLCSAETKSTNARGQGHPRDCTATWIVHDVLTTFVLGDVVIFRPDRVVFSDFVAFVDTDEHGVADCANYGALAKLQGADVRPRFATFR